jgi:hypothetical protein
VALRRAVSGNKGETMAVFLTPDEFKNLKATTPSSFLTDILSNTIKTGFFARLVAVLALLLVCLPAYAHHGASMFDMEHLITVKGTVTSFEWINPHSMIYADVKDDKGNVQKWAIETRGGPNALSRAGWTKDTLKPGDEVTFTGHPAKNGTSNMRLTKVTLANGKEMEPESHSWF